MEAQRQRAKGGSGEAVDLTVQGRPLSASPPILADDRISTGLMATRGGKSQPGDGAGVNRRGRASGRWPATRCSCASMHAVLWRDPWQIGDSAALLVGQET